MKKGFKFILAILFAVLSASQALAQVNVNVQIRPPFTPFIADYINPAKLQDITVSVLNTSTSEVRVKFKFSLTNISKGISLSIKESSSPLKPYVLNPNEFRFVQLEDVSRLYGKITYTDFNVNGIDIQRAIADGTVPDGMYEFCIEAFDYDAPGFSRPLGGGRPQGCGIFQVIYPDPPSDIRLNNQLLNYSFGGNIPQVNRMGSGVQLYQVNFTPPVPSLGSQYQYELYVFDEQTLNPRMMSETQMLSAFEVLPPYIRKTSMSPVFMIDQSDLPLDENKNYYLFIKVNDLSNKTIFKNKGVSSIQAFQLQNTAGMVISTPDFKSSVCDKQLIDPTKEIRFTWEFSPFLNLGNNFWNQVSFQVKILRFNSASSIPSDLFSAQTGMLVKDTILRFTSISAATGNLSYLLVGLNSSDQEIYQKKYAAAVRVIPDPPFKNMYTLVNEGISNQCIYISGSPIPQQIIPLDLPIIAYEVNYPLQDDTLPFMYVPVVVEMSPLHSASEIVLTKFRNQDEPYKNGLSYQAFIQKPNASSVNRFNKLVYPGIFQSLIHSSESESSNEELEAVNTIKEYLPFALQMQKNNTTNRLVLGGQIKYKEKQAQSTINILADAALLGMEDELPRELNSPLNWNQYSNPGFHRPDITWSLKVGTYSASVRDTIPIERYFSALVKDRILIDFRSNDLISKGYGELSGRYTLGMKKPQLHKFKSSLLSPGQILFTFSPSGMPRKLLPTIMNGPEWIGKDSFKVAQQYNLEVSRNADFSDLLYVKSNIIFKTYHLPNEQAQLIKDLYSSVSLPLELQQTGQYYWRVTWSNISADAVYKNPLDFQSGDRFGFEDYLRLLNLPTDKVNAENRESFEQFYRYILNMEAEASLIGENSSPAFINSFGRRRAYLISDVDSFQIKIEKNDPVSNGEFQLSIAYPLNGDTIPFQYPPIILNHQSADTNILALITRMEGDLEIAPSNRIFFRKSHVVFEAQISDLSLNEAYQRVRVLLEQCADGGDEIPPQCQQALDVLKGSENMVGTDFVKSASPLLPIGQDLDHKLKLARTLLNYSANRALLGDESYFNDPKIGQIIYALPYKNNLTYKVQARTFSTNQNSIETERIDSAALNFWSGRSKSAQSIELTGNYNVGMKQAVLSKKNGQKLLPGNIEFKFRPSSEPAKLFPDLQGVEQMESFKWLNIAQQYNIEVAKDPEFREIVKVLSRPIIRTYQFPIDISKIRNDLYGDHSETIDLQDIGVYYWRITWSNVTIDLEKATPAEIDYFRRTANLIANAGLIGDQSSESFTDPFDLFTKRINYVFSQTDSFIVANDIVSFTLNYPLEGDTIPFMYPPVVLNRSSMNNKGEIALFTSFNSDLEPLLSNRYFLVNKRNELTDIIRSFKFDTSYREISAILSESADAALEGNDEISSRKLEEALTLFRRISPNFNNILVEQFSGLAPLGNPSKEKRSLAKLSLNVNAEAALMGMDFLVPLPKLMNMVYLKPFKNDIRWIARAGVYFDHNAEEIPLKDYLSAFQNGELMKLYGNTELIKNAFVTMNGSFNVGMKTPEIAAHGGKSFTPGVVSLSFKPSGRPRKLLPEGMSMQNEWSEFLHLNVAQQLNIEVSRDREFKSLDTLIQIPIAKNYLVPRDISLIEQDLYTNRTISLSIQNSGMYYWRVTWSNIVAGDSLTKDAKDALRQMIGVLSDATLLGDDTPYDLIDVLYKRTNYIISSADSFKIEMESQDSASKCGMNCVIQFNDNIPVRHTSLGNGIFLKVGKFNLKTNSIIFGNDNLASGTGTIEMPYLNAPIRVVFNNIGINSDLRVVSGQVTAVNDKLGFIRQGVSQEAQTNLWDAIYNEISSKSANDGGLLALSNALNENGNLVQSVFTNNPVTLPLGISTAVGNQQYTISLTDLTFKPDRADANLIAIFPIGFSDKVIGFGAKELCINPQGFADLNNGGTLKCIKNVTIPLGSDMSFTIKGSPLESNDPACELKWNCDGFQHFEFAADLTIPQTILQKVQNGQKVNTPVVAGMSGRISTMSDWMLGIDLSGEFELPQLPGYSLTFNNVFFDWSDTKNPLQLAQFPEGYQNAPADKKHWRGLYAGEIGIRLPKELGGREENNRFEFSASNILIDQYGFTGKLEGNNIFSIANGKLADWKSSLDTLSVTVVQNTFRNGRIAGKIQVPVMDRPLPYFGTLAYAPESKLSYELGVRPEGMYQMPFMVASVNLLSTSSIKLTHQEEKFKISAMFNGDIGFGNGSIGGIENVNFGRLPFQGFTIESASNGLDIKLANLGGVDLTTSLWDAKENVESQAGNALPEFGGFPITIENFRWDTPNRIAFPTEDGNNNEPKFGIKIKLVLNLSKITPASQEESDPSGFGIAGRVGAGIYGIAKMDPTDGLKVSFAGLDVDTMEIKALLSGVLDVEGKIAFFNGHDTFGNGLAGFVNTNITPGLKFQMGAMFGEKDNYRYWMVDAKVELPKPGFPLDFGLLAGYSPLYAYGIGGGMWYKMQRQQGQAQAGAGLGRSESGGIYTPNGSGTPLFGMELGVSLTGAPGTALYGDMFLRAELNDNGSVASLGLSGNLWHLEENKKKAPIFLNGTLEMDLNNSRIEGTLSANVNIAQTVRGLNEQNIDGITYYNAGICRFYVDVPNEKWYFHAGNPTEPMGIKLTIPNLQNGLGIKNYLMVGNTNFIQPEYPKEIQTIFKQNNLSLPVARRVAENGLLAMYMGGSLTLPTFNETAGPFYFRIAGAVGFDGAIDQNIPQCNNLTGINGWYLNTTGYMGIQASAGVNIASPFYTGAIDFGKITAAGIVNAGFVNPLIVSGHFSSNYTLFGGAVSGVYNCSFNYSQPSNCVLDSSIGALALGSIIKEVLPVKEEQNVSITQKPSVLFNYKYNSAFILKVPNPENPNKQIEKLYVLESDPKQFQLTRFQSRSKVPVGYTMETSADGYQLSIIPDSFLRPNTRYEWKMRFVFYEYVGKNKRELDDTSFVITFTTGNAPSVIDENAILYTHPVIGQNFYIHASEGKIVFDQQNLGELFPIGEVMGVGPQGPTRLGNKFNYFVELFNLNNREITEIPFNVSGNELRFNMHVTQPQTSYVIRIVREELYYPELDLGRNGLQSQLEAAAGNLSIDKNYANMIDGNRLVSGSGSSGSGGFYTINTGNRGNYTLRSDASQRTFSEVQDRKTIMFAFNFRTSRYSKKMDKLEQITLKTGNVDFEKAKASELTLESEEMFDLTDVKPTKYGSVVIPPEFYIKMLPETASNWHRNEYRNNIYRADSILGNVFGQVSALYHSDFRTNEIPVNYLPDRKEVLDRMTVDLGSFSLPMKQLPASYDYRLMTRISPSLSTEIANTIERVSPAMRIQLEQDPVISFDAFGRSYSSGSSNTSSTPATSPSTSKVPEKANIRLLFNDLVLAEGQFQRALDYYFIITDISRINQYDRLTQAEKSFLQQWSQIYAIPGSSDVFEFYLSQSLHCSPNPYQFGMKTLPPNCKSYQFRGPFIQPNIGDVRFNPISQPKSIFKK